MSKPTDCRAFCIPTLLLTTDQSSELVLTTFSPCRSFSSRRPYSKLNQDYQQTCGTPDTLHTVCKVYVRT